MKKQNSALRRLNRLWMLAGGLFIVLNINAQSATEFWNSEMQTIAKPESNPDWVYIKDDVQLDPSQIFISHTKAFGLGSDDEFKINKVEGDELGYQHHRYDQYYKGLEVIGGEFIVHENELGHVYLANGKMILGISISEFPMITEPAALNSAMDFIGVDEFLWQEDLPEYLERDQTMDKSRYNFPEGKLVFVRTGTDAPFQAEFYSLAWEYELYVPGGEKDARVFVDALSGEVIDSYPLSMICDGATGTTTWDGSRSFNTDLFFSDYDLYDDCGLYGGGTIQTLDDNFGGSDLSFFDTDNNWLDYADRHGVTTHWGVKESKRYFNLAHGRLSHNNAGGGITAKNNIMISGSWNNACYCGGELVFGPGDGVTYDPNKHWNTLDIVAHEYTHAVIVASANLTYSNESGALNESFSDIFGNVIPRYLGLGSTNWLIGEDRNYGTGAIRDMANPNAFNHPDTYFGTNWYIGTADAGGVHTNSGVQNKWFQLLTDGGSGSTDFGDAYSVSSIGITKSRAIAYRNLTVYLTSGSQYFDARQGSIQAANDLYGSCSNESIQTGLAWYGVGVGTSYASYDLTLACGSYAPLFFSLTYTGVERLRTTLGCATTILASSSSVTFRSAEEVVLREGFEALDGSGFTAKIDPCSYTVYRESDEFAPEEELEESISIAPEKLMQMSVSPNPFTNQFNLMVNLAEETQARIRMIDVMGRTVKQITKSELLFAGTNQYNVDAYDLPSGIYLIVLETDTYREELRVEHIQ